MEKLVLSLVFAAKRLRRYFQAYPIAVITNQPIKQILSRPNMAGRLQKWNVMLGEHNITYRPRTSVKGQILADFLVEKPDKIPPDASVVETPQEPWTLFTDGSSCVDGSGAGLILTSPEGTEFTYALRFQFTASNNEAEYEALIAGLRIAAQMGVRNVHVSVDSKLVANQVLGTYVAKEENMVKYLEKAKSLISGFANFSISQVPRSKNKKADALSKIASTSFAHLSKQVLVEILKEKSIQEEEVATVVEEEGPTWMTPIMEYLKNGTLPGDRKEASKLRIKARQYELLEGVLYRRSFLKPWLRCVGPLQADYVIREIHEGSCSMHAGPRSVVAKAMRNPQQQLTPITAPWPFYKWGIDIAGPFPEGPGKVKKFVWDNIVCRFSLPEEIVSDNGKQFSDNLFKDWCDKLNITQRFTSVKHPQSNGLVERANRSLGEGIKSRMGEGNKNWIEELPHVLWAHRTMIKSSHGDTPFALTYGTEAVISAEIRMPTNSRSQSQVEMTKYYNARVRGVTFRPGDFVYRSNDASRAVDGGKLGSKWEGPYEVTEALGDVAYRLSLSRSIRQQDSKTLRGNAINDYGMKLTKITFQVYAAKRDGYTQDNESTKATLAMDALSQLLLPFEFGSTISAIATLFVYLGRAYGGAKYPVVPKTRAEIKPLSFFGLILANPKSDTRILVYLKSRCMTDGMEVIVERERNDHVTTVKADTLKLIVQIPKTPKLSSPFPDEHLSLTLGETPIEMFDPKGIISWSVARVDWSELEWHMKSYRLKDISSQFIENILWGGKGPTVVPVGASYGPLTSGIYELIQVPWTNERLLENRELNAIIGAWFTLWRD
ncbi:reverse transcriptase domain-containing protein [Tanacetum coccineum]